MNTPASVEQLNAQYVHALIGRWECVLDRAILARHGVHGGQSSDVTDDVLRQRQAGFEAECANLSGVVAKAGGGLPLERLATTYGLDPVEFQLLQMAMIPVLELSFRQRLARYNNNILQDFLDVALALELLFPNRVDRLAARTYFDDDAPLIRHRLVTLRVPSEVRGTGLNAMELVPAERLADQILCHTRLDASLKGVAELLHPDVALDQVIVEASAINALSRLTSRFKSNRKGVKTPWEPEPFGAHHRLIVQLTGSIGSGAQDVALGIIHALNRRLLRVDCVALERKLERDPEVLSTLFAEARSQGLVVVLTRCEEALIPGGRLEGPLASGLSNHDGLVFILARAGATLSGQIEAQVMWQVDLDQPDAAAREALWRRHRPEGIAVSADVDWSDLANRYELHGGQIQNAWAAAARLATVDKTSWVVSLETLRQSAHAQIRANMSDYSIKSQVNLSLDALVLPKETQDLVSEALAACQNRVFVMSKWGFGQRLVTGKGICMLFKGEPGTGKTFCAEILASVLGMKLYQVSIPKIVSKYVGETEKNISKIFHSARASHSMLLFDEADALFTKRVSVEHAIDRFSNMETNLLLQEIERFEGITILTTNLDKNFDDAFARRIQFKIDFPFPDAEHRARIWSRLFPPDCPVEEGLDFEDLGERFELSGGHIKNAVLRAAYRAAGRQDGGGISLEDIDFAAKQECKNAGKLFRSGDGRQPW